MAAFNTAKFKSAVAGNQSVGSVLQQVWAMIQALIAAGQGAAIIKAEVDALIAASGLPIFLQPLIISLVNGTIDAILAAKPNPAPAGS
jgi:hypothetical protein